MAEKIKTENISIERNTHGAWVLATVYNGYRVQRSYTGYTKREAVAHFKKDAVKA